MPASSARDPAEGEHALGVVDPDHAHARLRDRDGDPPGADAELDDGPARLPCLCDVEVDVLGDAAAPRVVERGDGVIGAT